MVGRWPSAIRIVCFESCTTCAYGGAPTCVDPCWEGGLAHVGANIHEFEALGVEVGKIESCVSTTRLGCDGQFLCCELLGWCTN